MQAQASEPELAPSPALACLMRATGSAEKPEYPEDQLLRRQSAKIAIKLVFTRPDKAPDIELTNPNVDEDFADATKTYARGYRLPCLKEGAPAVTLTQEYFFDPNDGRRVMNSQLKDAADEERQKKLECVTRIDHETKMMYPFNAAQLKQSGKFLAELTFTDPDKAPEIKWLAESKGSSMKRAAEEFAAGYRLPCVGQEPIKATMIFTFILPDVTESTVFEDMSLKQFVVLSKDAPRPAYFDLNTMACPFDVRIGYMRPYTENKVREIETTNPARKPLLEWLAKISLDLTPKQSLSVLGESFNLHIPCGKVDL